MSDEKDVVIEIPQDDPVVTVAEEKKIDVGGDDKITTAAEGIDDLKQQLETVNKQREEDAEALRLADERRRKAEADAEKARQEASRFKDEHEKANYDTIVNAIDAVNREAELATKEYEDALGAGDYKSAAVAQRKIARAEGRLVQLESGKQAMDDAVEARKNAKSEPQKSAGDPIEEYIGKFSPRSQRWLTGHKDYVTDAKKNLRLIAAHNEAVAEDFVPDSDGYFDFIERKLGLKADPKAEADVQPQAQPQKQRTAVAAAPVSRDPGNGNGGARSSQITLTPGEQRAATDGTIVWNYDDPQGKFKRGDVIGLKEMAIRKAALQKNGAYDRSYTDQ